MMACAADSIVMGFASDLGPIDPQVLVPDASGRRISRPAHSYLAGLDDKKAGVRSRAAATLWAFEHDLVRTG